MEWGRRRPGGEWGQRGEADVPREARNRKTPGRGEGPSTKEN